MKLSIAWIFDHIAADWKQQNIDAIVSKFNKVTAEIEDYYEVIYDLTSFALGQVKGSVIDVPEWKKEFKLLMHTDFEQFPNGYFMVMKDSDKVRWATCKDFKLDKDGLLPAFYIDEKQFISGEWKAAVEARDIILEVDNKSITHRPDMWGHRGFAREIAAFMNLPFVPKQEVLKKYKVVQSEKQSASTITNPFEVNNQTTICNRFSGLYFSNIENKPSELSMAFRLMKVGSRAINAMVDLTNYVMLDWSQPTHVFDADKLDGKSINIRRANNGEILKLLDGRNIELTKDDLVIADAKAPVALAGVMGGLEDSLSKDTKSIFLESANFDAATIRRTATRYKSRTEASARFEKSLDPNQITDAIMRFIFLAEQMKIKMNYAEEILVIGKPFMEKVINITQEFLDNRAGFTIKEEDVVAPLTKLGFTVSVLEDSYDVTIPSFRGFKDVREKEDILEEIIRFYGFDKIALEMPVWLKRPYSLANVFRQRKIKNYFKNAACMIEQQNYILYDENFLKTLSYEPPKNTINLTNPVAENQYRLINSLIPGLLKNIQDNFTLADKFYFFEFGRIWSFSDLSFIEKKSITGIFFHKREQLDFYSCKEKITSFLKMFSIVPDWIKSDKNAPWYNSYQTAKLMLNNNNIGVVGKLNPVFLTNLGILPDTEALAFELDADFILSYNSKVSVFKPLSRYQEVSFDLSAFVPLSLQVADIQKSLSGVDKYIQNVSLIDFFEKDEKRSLAFRLRLINEEKTFDKEEIESIRTKAIKALEKLGANLRT